MELNLRRDFICLQVVIILFASSCFNSRLSKATNNGNGVKIENFWSNDFYITKVTDNGKLVYYKAQKDSIVQIISFDPLCQRISVSYDFLIKDSLSFSYNSAVRFRQDVDSGELLLQTYCNGCHYNRDTTMFWLDRNAVSLSRFDNNLFHAGLIKYRFDKTDLINIYLADSIARLDGY